MTPRSPTADARRRHLGGGPAATASRQLALQCRPALRHRAVCRCSARGAGPSPPSCASPPAAAITTSRETREFNSGGLFSNGDNNVDKTSSNGFSPRVILTYEPDDNIRVNAQASKGFRLGGVNDPLNIPLCNGGANGIDAQTYGNRPNYEDETLWNYELGVRGQRRG